MRERFRAKRRLALPVTTREAVVIDPPPELPRLVEQSVLRRAAPWLIGLAVVGWLVWMISTGNFRSPMTIIMPLMAVMASANMHGGRQGMSKEELNAERADYLRALDEHRANLRHHATQQRAALAWSHPAPGDLNKAIGTPRQWERDLGDPDHLHVRLGLHAVALDTPIRVSSAPAEVDSEPVCLTALQHLRSVQQTLPSCPVALNLATYRRVIVHTSDRSAARNAVAAWLTQAAVWHNPVLVGVAIASDALEEEWGWAKWLPHTERFGKSDGAGPARALAESPQALAPLLAESLDPRPAFEQDASDNARHWVVVTDMASNNARTLPPGGKRDAVEIVITTSPPNDDDLDPNPDERFLRLEGSGPTTSLSVFERGEWRPYVSEADLLAPDAAQFTARKLARWDANPSLADPTGSARKLNQFLSQIGVENAADLDIAALQAPRPRSEELRVPVGVTSAGEPFYLDLKDEAEGGDGPHGVLIGMTGSGKSTAIQAILLPLLLFNDATRFNVIAADFKGEAGADEFRDFPQVVGVVSNMQDKTWLVERFGDTLLGILEKREEQLRDAGRRVQGKAFASVADYEASGHDLEPIPTLLVLIDEFSLMLADRPEMAGVLDIVARKGRSLRVHILFASQTLDQGRIKDIDKNLAYKIGLKVASEGIARQIIGTPEPYNIPPGPENKGRAYIKRGSATPVAMRFNYVHGVYDPPRRSITRVHKAAPQAVAFTAAEVPSREETTTTEYLDTVPVGPPKTLVAIIAEQLANAPGQPVAPTLWLPPMDDPRPLDHILAEYPSTTGTWTFGEIDLPRKMCRVPLVHDLNAANANLLVLGGEQTGKTTALLTFVLAAAATHTPRQIGFYCLDHNSGALHALAGLPHVSSVSDKTAPELTRRALAELQAMVASRLRTFRAHGIASLSDYRARREADPEIADQHPADVFLVIDGYTAFKEDNLGQWQTKNIHVDTVKRLLNEGANYGVHLLISNTRFFDLDMSLQETLTRFIELRTDPSVSKVKAIEGKRPAASVPTDQPGRGLNPQAEHLRVALPRIDGSESTNELHTAVRTAVTQIAARHTACAPKVRLLPTALPANELAPILKGNRIALGLRESDLQPFTVDLRESPITLLYGARKTGKSSALRHVIEAIRTETTTETAMVVLVDPARRHADVQLDWDEHEYIGDDEKLASELPKLVSHLQRRVPPPNATPDQISKWRPEGPDIFVIVDDLDRTNQQAWAPLLPWLSRARDVGLRLFAARNTGGLTNALFSSPLLRVAQEAHPVTVLLRAEANDGKILGIPPQTDLPPGRGLVVSHELNDHVHLAQPPRM